MRAEAQSFALLLLLSAALAAPPASAQTCTAADGEEAVLQNETVTQSLAIEVCNKITTHDNYSVSGPNGDLDLRAGYTIQFGNGFSITPGGRLSTAIDIGLASDRPADWTDAFVWVHRLDTDLGTVWPADGWGTGCDATEQGDTPPALAFTAQEGNASVTLSEGLFSDSHLLIDWTNGSCNEARVGGDVSTGCWVRRTTCAQTNCPQNEVVTVAFNPENSGWNLMVRGVGGCFGVDHCARCYTDGLALAETATPITDGWSHIQMSVDDAAGSCTMFLNGVDDTVSVGSNPGRMVPTNNGSITLGDRGRSLVDGNLDECYQYNGQLSPAAAKRIWACGINGAQCRCDGEAYTDCGRANPNCTGLPPCNAPGPS